MTTIEEEISRNRKIQPRRAANLPRNRHHWKAGSAPSGNGWSHPSSTGFTRLRDLTYRMRRGAIIRDYLAGGGMKALHIGCGPNRKEGWLNTDVLPLRLPWRQGYDGEKAWDFPLDITQPLPFPDNSLDIIFGEEVIEHIEYFQAVRFFAEARRVLKPGGVLKLTTPSWKAAAACFWRTVRSTCSNPIGSSPPGLRKSGSTRCSATGVTGSCGISGPWKRSFPGPGFRRCILSDSARPRPTTRYWRMHRRDPDRPDGRRDQLHGDDHHRSGKIAVPAARLEVETAIEFTGRLDANGVGKAHVAADLCIFLAQWSFDEGLASAPFEAASYGVPTVMSHSVPAKEQFGERLSFSNLATLKISLGKSVT